MTNAIILSAGQGRRLSPLTDDRPKCLVEIGGRSMLEWQLRGLADNDVRDVAVVAGFGAEMVEKALDRIAPALGLRAQAIYNPFYSVADNIGSCWAAKDHFTEDTVLLNGDTLFEGAVLARLLATSGGGITVVCDAKEHYDGDDMKVRVSGDRLTAIGKTLEGDVDGESIGMIRFRGDGGARFVGALRAALADETALRRWYLSIIDELAKDGAVHVARLQGERWSEVDFLTDLPVAKATVRAFREGQAVTRTEAV